MALKILIAFLVLYIVVVVFMPYNGAHPILVKIITIAPAAGLMILVIQIILK